ncbi:MAG: SDR family NAD(P)-dependent oxidoreductase [Clostridia bacterium]|nr:SDR family NAD(P)-dependent oxidoreductase [Clostridia bacterium]
MKISIISGASSGIGKELARELDKKGLDELWLIALEQKGLDELKSELNTTVRAFAFDLTKNECFDMLKLALQREHAEVMYLVCSAGVGFNGNFDGISEERINLTIELNCIALTRLTKCVEPYLVNGSRVIEIASGSGFAPQPGFAVYSASKAYVISLSRALNKEFKKKGASVTAVCPGPVDTSFFASLENVKEYKKRFVITPKKVAKKAIKCADKGRALCVPSLSMKLFHLASKIVPTSILISFC